MKNKHNLSIKSRERIKNGFPKGIPQAYKALNKEQKDLLAIYGASKLLLYLGKIDQIYSVITKKDRNTFEANLDFQSDFFNNENKYWVYDFREQKLKEKVTSFLSRKPDYKGKIFIAYGVAHDLSDEFENYIFERGAEPLSSTNLHWLLYSSLKGKSFVRSTWRDDLKAFLQVAKDKSINMVKSLMIKNDGFTALMEASSRGDKKLVKTLLDDKKVKVNAKNKYGNTALMIASSQGHTDIVKLLISDDRVKR